MSHRIVRIVVLLVVGMLPLRVPTVEAASASRPADTSIAAGLHHTCALTSGGRVRCWGRNNLGQLGNGTTVQSSTPVEVKGLGSGVAAIAAGRNHTCALTRAGGVMCWGENNSYQLGNGAQDIGIVPVIVPGLSSGVSAISAGGGHTCALTQGGGVKCWGHTSPYGTALAADISGLTAGAAAITSGSDHSCALTSSGVMCFSIDSSIAFEVPRAPVAVPGLPSGVGAIAAGGRHTCAFTIAAGVRCWGTNGSGQLGNGLTTSSTVPVGVIGLPSGVGAISAGGLHTCALSSGGGVKCWGENASGQLGNGATTSSTTPVDVVGLASGVSAISAGANHTCVRTTGGEIKCWGSNSNGQLGDGTTTWSTTAVDVDFAYQDPPETATDEPGVRPRPAGFPLLPLLAGLVAGIGMLVRNTRDGWGARRTVTNDPASGKTRLWR